MWENPFIFELIFISIMGTSLVGEWSVHHIMREEVEAPSRGRHPFGMMYSLRLYIDGWSLPLPSLLISWPFGWSLLPLSADPPYEIWFRRSPAQIVSPPTSPRHSAVGVSRWIIYFRCPAGTRDLRSSSSHTCDRVQKCCPFAALVFITIFISASEPLHHPREPFSLMLCVFEGELLLSTIYLLLASPR
jgi:hypothetical protein